MPPNWTNQTLWTGDNLDVMRGMNSDCVDLIYLDPPFNSNQDYAAPIGGEQAMVGFKDTWTLNDVDLAWHGEIAESEPALYSIIDSAGLSHGKGMKSYLIMMAVRLLEMRRILKDTGSIYLHCDDTASHYLKTVMDSVFGASNYKNEITWKRTTAHNDPGRYGRISDSILFYTKSPEKTFNHVRGSYSDAQLQRYKYSDENGPYRAENLTAPHFSPTRTVEWRGVNPGSNRQWRFSVDELERLYSEGRILLRRDGLPRKDGYKSYLHEAPGPVLQDFWNDIALGPTAGERTQYPTQKPLALLERIIQASSNEGDMVLDPFCGCATACVAAEKLGRHWAGIDISPNALVQVNNRLRNELGLFSLTVTHRTDIPRRTDLGPIPHYRTQKHTLFGMSEGKCQGCLLSFPFRNLTIDHIIPQSRGGTDHIDNLQLLCGACNSTKGTTTNEEFLVKLKAMGLR